jgi:hypothetical protein
MQIDRPAFYAAARTHVAKTLSKSQIEGFEEIFDVWDGVPHYDLLEWLAYILATAWHETGRRMQPVRESFAKSDAQAYQRVSKYCADNNKKNYAARHANGHSYYGRGYVQLTHGVNYIRAGKELGLGSALYDDPDRVLDVGMGARIIVEGMVEGWFTKYDLTDFFSRGEQEWYNARQIINRFDKASTIAQYGKDFLACLEYA